jgi:GNAT superfamily N-acetyltransferase
MTASTPSRITVRALTGDEVSARVEDLADVAKMLVYRRARRQGVAQRLLDALDGAARQHGKSVLVLDTVTGSDAWRLYQRAGWQLVGDVPNYALMPDGAFCSTTYFCKAVSSR